MTIQPATQEMYNKILDNQKVSSHGGNEAPAYLSRLCK
jgi:hypothetical protein